MSVGEHDPGPQLVRAQDLFAAGELDECETIVREVLAAAPDEPQALFLLGRVAHETGHLDAAVPILQRACEVSPQVAAYRIALARALAAARLLGEAAAAYREALAIDSDDSEAWRELAETLHGLGDLTGAIAACQRALANAGDDVAARNRLGVVLGELGRLDEALTAFRTTAKQRPDLPQARLNAGTTLARMDRLEEALTELDAALALCAGRSEDDPDLTRAHANRGELLARLGRTDEALADLTRAHAGAPQDFATLEPLIRLLLTTSPERALAVSERFLERRPGHSGGVALQSKALTVAGARDRAAALLDVERFVRVVRLRAPANFPDLATFNEALAEHVLAHPSLTRDPASHATRHGQHSGSLLAPPQGPIAALEELFNQAVAELWSSLPDGDPHPFVAHRPPDVFLDLWAVVLEAGGHQVPHIHPDAWLSGVYYVALPPGLSDTSGSEGWLELGEPDQPELAPLYPHRRAIPPLEGQLVLFPSYLYHRTLPFQAAGRRISIAFDVVPLRA